MFLSTHPAAARGTLEFTAVQVRVVMVAQGQIALVSENSENL